MTHRRRNRSVSTIPTYDKKEISNEENAFSYINSIEKVLGENVNDSINTCSGEKHAFGDYMSEDKSTISSDLEGLFFLVTNICLNHYIVDIFDLKLSEISASSSLTWSDDYDYEVSKKVQSELEKIDRCFQGIEKPIYYKEEIDEWLHYFPHLS